MCAQRNILSRRLASITLLAVIVVGILLSGDLLTINAQSGRTETGSPFDGGTPPTLCLDITSGPSGGVSEARIQFDPADGIRGFNLLLQFTPGLLAGSASDFQRNPIFFPPINLGQHELNVSRNAGLGRIRLIGLAPAAKTGAVEIGAVHLHMAPNAKVGASQVITLTGEVNLAGTGVVTIAPVIATVRVVSSTESMYLPLIRR